MNFQIPDILRFFWGKVVWRGTTSSKVVYLTFDDGPVPEVTPKVLDILSTYGLKATFFCVADNVRKYPHVYQRLIISHHSVGNHTYNHLRGFRTSSIRYVDNVMKASAFIESSLFRPPHGQITFSQKRKLSKDYRIVMWDIITHDYNPKITSLRIMETIRKKVRNGSIIVFHDSVKAYPNVIEALPVVIEFLQSEGYSFETL